MFLEFLKSKLRLLAHGFLKYLIEHPCEFKYNALRFRAKNENACLVAEHTQSFVVITMGEVCGHVVGFRDQIPFCFAGC